jgi:SSS family solute:Na+ symporter
MQLVRVGQFSTLILVFLASMWAPVIESFPSLFQYLQIILSFIAPPVAAAFIVGMFWRRSNADGGFYSLMFGLLFAVVILGMTFTGTENFLTEMHFLHRTFYLFFACILVNIVVSKQTPPPPAEKLDGYTWNNTIIPAETKALEGVVWYKNYRYQAVALLIVTFVLVAFFW